MSEFTEQLKREVGYNDASIEVSEDPWLISQREETRGLVQRLFKDDQGKPITLTDGQCDIFNLIWKKPHHRCHIQTHTRYGKSLTIALATLMRITTFPEKFTIVSGSNEQAGIIMGYIIQHIFDNPYFEAKFRLDPGESAEQIRRHRNKKQLNFVVFKKGEVMDDKGTRATKDLMGEIFLTNAKGAMGFGAPNVILDEAALVKDTEEAQIFRMLGDEIEENYYIKIGNPFESDHFRSSAEDPNYYHLDINYLRGIKEGRCSWTIINEAKKKPFFDILYENKFPARDSMDDDGWMPLLTKEDIDKALIDTYSPFGVNKLGVDKAGQGVNFNVAVQRHTNVARLVLKESDLDSVELAEKLINGKRSKRIGMDEIAIDIIGVGEGTYDIARREITMCVGFKGSYEADDIDQFINKRAECYWRAREWILGGGKLLRGKLALDSTWYELTKIRYKQSIEAGRGKLKIMPKEMMWKKYRTPSPDVADAFSMTFCNIDAPSSEYEMRRKASEDIAALHSNEQFDVFPQV